MCVCVIIWSHIHLPTAAAREQSLAAGSQPVSCDTKSSLRTPSALCLTPSESIILLQSAPKQINVEKITQQS